MMPNRHTSHQSSRFQRWLKPFMKGVFRSLWWFSGRRRRATARAGFVFPTTLLLLLMVTLTATALTYRTFSRSNQAITQRQQQVIYNAATPAIDRAKSKLEFMFRNDNRFPAGVPPSDQLANLMLPYDDAVQIDGAVVAPITALGFEDNTADPYTLPGEERLQLTINDTNGAPQDVVANAWMFRADDIDGDDIEEYVIYSITSDNAGPLNADPTAADTVLITDPDDETKAKALVTRTGPLATTEATPLCKGARSEAGWQVVAAANNSALQKNFQVNAIVVKSRDITNGNASPVLETLEFQQSRIAARANKWGAWFRYDLEIHPGPGFNWNGAMHTDGNLIMDSASGLTPYMVSSFNSCLYSQESSEITMGTFEELQGQAIAARMAEDEFRGGNTNVHVFDGAGRQPRQRRFNTGTDSVDANGGRPSDISMNPLALFTEGREVHNNADDALWTRDDDWATGDFTIEGEERIYNDETSRPFVDDFYRADDRWGPKPTYGNSANRIGLDDPSINATVGTDIPAAFDNLTDETGGLDGYWERQSINGGLRIIVGQRLELGNTNGWGYDPTEGVASDPNVNAAGDPLYPPKAFHDDLNRVSNGADASNDIGGNHEYLHKKSLRDNLAAVQGMVVYHYEYDDGEFPAACMALTAHPGTEQTVINSRTFEQFVDADGNPAVSAEGDPIINADFFNGVGTNGWEFEYPDIFSTPGGFEAQVTGTSPLNRALRNLAFFAGDPNGGAPTFVPVQDGNVHPYPYQAMWGDYSALRRIIDDGGLNNQAAFRDLSPADQATVHSAACTLSLLAFNVGNVTPPPTLDEVADLSTASITDARLAALTQATASAMEAIINYMDDGTDTEIITGVNASDLFEAFTPEKDTTWTDPNDETVNGNCPAGTDAPDFQPACDAGEYFEEYTWDDWQVVLDVVTPATDDEIAQIKTLGTNLGQTLYEHLSYPYLRDRDLGFRKGLLATLELLPSVPSNQVTWDTTTGFTEPVTLNSASSEQYIIKTACNPNYFGRQLDQGSSAPATDITTLGLISCAAYFRDTANAPPLSVDELSTARYPSLYYLFPLQAHDQDGTGYHQQPDGIDLAPTVQIAEEYVADAYINTINPTNNSAVYQVVGSNIFTGMSEIAAVARSSENWILPAPQAAALKLGDGVKDNPLDPDEITPNGAPFRVNYLSNFFDVPFVDKGVYDSREMLSVRLLDIDIDRLTQDTAVADTWLSFDLDKGAEGVVYAFREDAVREDEIVRPSAGGDPADCQDFNRGDWPRLYAIERDNACFMDVAVPQDPPLSDRGVSFKPVDYIPDPERRPHGFRLRTEDGSPVDFSKGDREVGMTFVTDNSLHILGDFNMHVSVELDEDDAETVTQLEEFTDTILEDGFNFAEFYGGREQDELDLDNFASLTVDHWRPVELLADAISFVSKDFVDGYIDDTFTVDNNAAVSSYTNQTRPLDGNARIRNADYWVREVPGDDNSPVWIDRNATFYYDNEYDDANDFDPLPYYERYNNSRAGGNCDANGATWRGRDCDIRVGVQRANNDTYVNAVFVGGIVPSRPRQAYGGLHNYPRFLQDWETGGGRRGLYIQGSFIQLDFSTASTGPQDQDVLEPGAVPIADEFIDFYRPPNRFFGYDVALLYVPPGPAAERFVTIGSPRSEYYREVAADDPYIEMLKCATYANDGVDADGNTHSADDDTPIAGLLCPN